MSDVPSSVEPVVFVLGACQAPGAAIAGAFAQSGAKVILVDVDTKKMTRIAAQNPDQIETLAIPDCYSEAKHVLAKAWGSEPLSMVVNLLPLQQPRAITDQLRNLVSILRGLARGLKAGRGSIVTLVRRPSDPLAVVGHGMVSALQTGSTALAQAVAGHAIRVHVMSLPRDTPEIAVETLLYLAKDDAEQIASTTFELG